MTLTLTDFLLARIAEDEAPTWKLIPYACPPGCCAPEGWVGHRCLICDEESYGGTVEAITEIAEEHAEKVHRRARVLAECEAKRRIVEMQWHHLGVDDYAWGMEEAKRQILAELALPYADHPDYREEWRP